MTHRAAIFDLDGTLINTPAGIVQMMQDTLRVMGRGPAQDAAIRKMIGLPLETGVSHVLEKPADDLEVAEFISRYKARFFEWMVPQAQALLFPGVAKGLAALKQAGLALGVATSKHNRSAEAILRSAGIWDLFDAVAGADSVAAPKPDPEMALYVARALGCAPGDCAMIGDTVHDLEMGRAAGMRICAATYGVGPRAALASMTPDLIAEDFTVLKDALLGACWRKTATP